MGLALVLPPTRTPSVSTTVCTAVTAGKKSSWE
jgi:hypothetical protein